MAGYEDEVVPCPDCGLPARRMPFCAGVAIRGETVAKPMMRREKNPSLTHGYMDMDRFQEAHESVLRESRKRGVKPPDLFAEAKRRVASGEVTESRIAR